MYCSLPEDRHVHWGKLTEVGHKAFHLAVPGKPIKHLFFNNKTTTSMGIVATDQPFVQAYFQQPLQETLHNYVDP